MIKTTWDSVTPGAIRKRFQRVGLSKMQCEQTSTDSFELDDENLESEDFQFSKK